MKVLSIFQDDDGYFHNREDEAETIQEVDAKINSEFGSVFFHLSGRN